MPNIGPLEVAIVAIIALIIFGPKRLPELGKSLGDGMREFKASISGENDDDEDDDDELPAQIEDGVAEEDPDEAVVADDTEDESAPDSDQSAETAERTTS